MIGLVIGLLVGSVGTALASNDYVQAVYAKFNIAVDSAESVEVEALVNQGTSYYPIRVIADMLDSEVDYIDETRTIVIERPTIENSTEIETADNAIEDPIYIGGDEVVDVEEVVNNEFEEPQQEEYSREYIEYQIDHLEKLVSFAERRLNYATRDEDQELIDEITQEKQNHEAELQLWKNRLTDHQ